MHSTRFYKYHYHLICIHQWHSWPVKSCKRPNATAVSAVQVPCKQLRGHMGHIGSLCHGHCINIGTYGRTSWTLANSNQFTISVSTNLVELSNIAVNQIESKGSDVAISQPLITFGQSGAGRSSHKGFLCGLRVLKSQVVYLP